MAREGLSQPWLPELQVESGLATGSQVSVDLHIAQDPQLPQLPAKARDTVPLCPPLSEQR